jgi:hypothetical protein
VVIGGGGGVDGCREDQIIIWKLTASVDSRWPSSKSTAGHTDLSW